MTPPITHALDILDEADSRIGMVVEILGHVPGSIDLSPLGINGLCHFLRDILAKISDIRTEITLEKGQKPPCQA